MSCPAALFGRSGGFLCLRSLLWFLWPDCSFMWVREHFSEVTMTLKKLSVTLTIIWKKEALTNTAAEFRISLIHQNIHISSVPTTAQESKKWKYNAKIADIPSTTTPSSALTAAHRLTDSQVWIRTPGWIKTSIWISIPKQTVAAKQMAEPKKKRNRHWLYFSLWSACACWA